MKTPLQNLKSLLTSIAVLLFFVQINAQNIAVSTGNKSSVNLMDFSVNYENSAAQLNWSAKIEKTFSHFIVEQSVDGNEFSDHAVFFGAENPVGVEKFSFKDNHINVAATNIYYRLKMTDMSGKISYSEVHTLRLKL